ncbi:hypothetical protein BJX63DRAFT_379799 [Aspergillus granulosus]|uniref:BZIP domain-containing protein n=1 Tax=Aspergillus granulosus TaxID=176169 RepID=A0ABR4HYR2_9EURO
MATSSNPSQAIYALHQAVALSKFPGSPQSFASIQVGPRTGNEFHSPEFNPVGGIPLVKDDLASMWQVPLSMSPSLARSANTGPVDTASGKNKKRQEQNRNAQRLYRQRKAQYVQSLLSHINEIHTRHTTLQNSYNALYHETESLQGQVQTLKEQLEFWSRVEVVLLKTPQGDRTIAESGTALPEDYSLYPDLSYHIGS